MAHREQFIQSRSNKAGVHFGEVLFAFSPQRKQAGSKPPKWYWWRSQFSCLASNEFKLRVSIIFDFATSTQSGHEPFCGPNYNNSSGEAFVFEVAHPSKRWSFGPQNPGIYILPCNSCCIGLSGDMLLLSTTLLDPRQQTTGNAAFLIGDNIKVKLKASWYDSTSLFLFFSPNEERSSKITKPLTKIVWRLIL